MIYFTHTNPTDCNSENVDYRKKRGVFIVVPPFLFAMVGSSSHGTGRSRRKEQKMSMDEIWAIEDENTFIVALTDHVMQKCEYGDEIGSLSGPERIFFVTQACEMEANNGGNCLIK